MPSEAANVDADIAKMPDGYVFQIGENGSKPSGGERQRIPIAKGISEGCADNTR